MNGQQRAVLKAAVDAKKREVAQVDPDDCGGAASSSRYDKGCRCASCKRKAADRKNEKRRAGMNVQTHNRNGYANGCRCEVCTASHAAHEKTRRKQAA